MAWNKYRLSLNPDDHTDESYKLIVAKLAERYPTKLHIDQLIGTDRTALWMAICVISLLATALLLIGTALPYPVPIPYYIFLVFTGISSALSGMLYQHNNTSQLADIHLIHLDKEKKLLTWKHKHPYFNASSTQIPEPTELAWMLPRIINRLDNERAQISNSQRRLMSVLNIQDPKRLIPISKEEAIGALSLADLHKSKLLTDKTPSGNYADSVMTEVEEAEEVDPIAVKTEKEMSNYKISNNTGLSDAELAGIFTLTAAS